VCAAKISEHPEEVRSSGRVCVSQPLSKAAIYLRRDGYLAWKAWLLSRVGVAEPRLSILWKRKQRTRALVCPSDISTSTELPDSRSLCTWVRSDRKPVRTRRPPLSRSHLDWGKRRLASLRKALLASSLSSPYSLLLPHGRSLPYKKGQPLSRSLFPKSLSVDGLPYRSPGGLTDRPRLLGAPPLYVPGAGRAGLMVAGADPRAKLVSKTWNRVQIPGQNIECCPAGAGGVVLFFVARALFSPSRLVSA